jgi:hypothetical protein
MQLFKILVLTNNAKIMENIETIKQIDIKELITKETGLQFKKNTLEHCPFCRSGTGTNKSPAFSVKPNDNIFTCFVCGKKGNPIEFVKFHKNLQNNEAVKYLAEKHTNLPKFEHVPEPETDLSKKIYAIKKNAKNKATEYLQSRKINTEKLPIDSYFYDDYFESVVFIDSENKLINQRVINPEPDKPKVMQSKGSILNNALYDKTFNSKSETVFIVESPINALSLFPYSSLAIFSTNNKFTDVEKFRKYLTNKKIILAFDNDVKKDSELNAGKVCTEYYKKLIQENIKFESLSVLLVPENKDINDLLQKEILFDFVKDSDNYDFVSIDVLKKPLPKNDKKVSKHFEVVNSCYVVRKYVNGNPIDMEISDCVFEFMYRLNDDDGTRLIKAQQTQINGNLQYRIEIFELASKELKKKTFETELTKHGFSFYGSPLNLAHITTYLKHKEQSAKIINEYGWHPEQKMFAFTDCIINSENQILQPNSIGMITDKKDVFYLQTASPANLNKFEDLKKFKYRKGNIDFKEFAELFYNSNTLNGSVGIQFYILSLFRDVVFNHLDFFPYLYLFGEAGAGKTSYVDVLLALFGDE